MAEKPKDVWLLAKMAAADYCFQATVDLADPPTMFPIRHLTKILTTEQGVQFGLWVAEKVGMTEGPILMRRDALLLLSAASAVLIDDVEKAWGMKPNLVGNSPKKLILPP